MHHKCTYRYVAECAIGLLKCKQRRLKYLPMLNEVELPQFILAACVLHNFILARHGLSLQAVPDFSDDDDDDENYGATFAHVISSRDGDVKRDRLAQKLYQNSRHW